MRTIAIVLLLTLLYGCSDIEQERLERHKAQIELCHSLGKEAFHAAWSNRYLCE